MLAPAAVLVAAGSAITADLAPVGLLSLLVTLVGLFIRNMLQDRGAGYTLADERQEDLLALRSEVELLRREVSDQRTLKHQALNELTIASYTLDTVRRLAEACTCHALEPLKNILDRRGTQ